MAIPPLGLWTSLNLPFPGIWAPGRETGFFQPLGALDAARAGTKGEVMASVVIVHAAEDALPARALAEKLRQAKLTVTLELPAGSGQLHDAIKAANASVALWSPRSVDQGAVVEDAQFAKKNGGVIHARMQNAALPQPFGSDKSIDLTGWRGEDEFAAWRDLAKAVTSKAGVGMIPPPPPRPPSGFFQPGAINPQAVAGAEREARRSPPPRAQQPRQAAPQQRSAPQQQRSAPQERSSGGGGGGGGKTMMIAIITFIVVAIAAGGGWYFYNNMQSTQAAQSTWGDLDKTDAAALRAFIAGTPGEFKDDAETALKQLEEQSWDAAQEADSIDAFQGFARDFPQSEHVLQARGRIAELQAQPVIQETTTDTTTATTTDPDLVPPNATGEGPAPLTPPAPAPTTTTTPPPTN